MRTKCCNYPVSLGMTVIEYNDYNKVVQCHNCGCIYEPKGTWTASQLAITVILTLVPCALAVWAAMNL